MHSWTRFDEFQSALHVCSHNDRKDCFEGRCTKPGARNAIFVKLPNQPAYLGTVFAMLCVLSVSIQHFTSAVILSPNFRWLMSWPGYWPCHVTKPLPKINNALVHACRHVVLLIAAPLMQMTILKHTWLSQLHAQQGYMCKVKLVHDKQCRYDEPWLSCKPPWCRWWAWRKPSQVSQIDKRNADAKCIACLAQVRHWSWLYT